MENALMNIWLILGKKLKIIEKSYEKFNHLLKKCLLLYKDINIFNNKYETIQIRKR